MGRTLALCVGAMLAVVCSAGCGDIREIPVEVGTDAASSGSGSADFGTTDVDTETAGATGSSEASSGGSLDPIGVCDFAAAAIPDGSAEGLKVTIDVDEPGASLAAVAMRVTHDHVGQLRVVVRHEGTSVTLVDHPGGGGCDGGGLEARFVDDAAEEVDSACDPGDGPAIGGDVKPLQELGAFDGMPLQGTWELQIIDDVAEIEGFLENWCIVMNR